MSTGARMPGKVVPWTGFEEWAFVKDCLLSVEEGDMLRGYEFVKMWNFRGQLPTAVEATANLVLLRTHLNRHMYPVADAPEGLGNDEHILRLSITMALVRFVNEMVDPLQTRSYAQPVSKLAEQIDLPRSLVDLRHEGTHDSLPSLGMLELALEQALEWLKRYYWDVEAGQEGLLAEKCLVALEKLHENLKGIYF